MKQSTVLRNSLWFVTLLVIISCGSDAKKNPIAPEPEIEVESHAFTNATTPIVLYKMRDTNNTSNISVQLLNYGLVEIGTPIQMKPFPFKYGRVEASIVETDQNGVATFIYNSPTGNDYDKIKGEDFILKALLLADKKDTNETSNTNKAPKILLEQSFLLQFR